MQSLKLDKSFKISEYDIKSSTKLINPNLPINTRLVGIFKMFLKINETLKEEFKVKAYKRAIINISKLQFDLNLKNVEILKRKKLVGDKLYKKVIEFLKTGKIQEIYEAIKYYNNYKELAKVKGLGDSSIKKLMKMNITTIEQLKGYKHLLNNLQLLGLKYYNDFNTKIPRAEVTELANKLRKYIDINIKVAGSYRRGSDYSSDIDIIVTLESVIKKYNNVEMFINKLKNWKDVVIEILSHGNKKITLIIKSEISNLVRQIDIIMIPEKYYFAALIYFTGNKDFNERIRSHVKKLGFKLNEYYLENIKTKEIILLKSERHLFEMFNLKYLTPEKRV